MSTTLRTLALFACVVFLPSVARAQAVITGTVKDVSGAVLPGVTVEASSPALIEKVRVAVTDGSGQYRIEELRPGTYTVTFTLTGFNTLKREGLELSGSFTASIDGELVVGALEETITVVSESPVVDVQSVRRQVTIGDEVIKALPSTRTFRTFVASVPGISTGAEDVGGLSGPTSPTFTFRGGRAQEGRQLVDGLPVGGSRLGSGVGGYIADVMNAAEVTVTTSGQLGEAEVSGPSVNIVPRVGGNRRSGTLFVGGSNGTFQSDNLTQSLRDAGLRQPAKLIGIWETSAAFGGPVVRDTLWYYVNTRLIGMENSITNMYENRNAYNPAEWTYDPDFDKPATLDGIWPTLSLRTTWQASPRNKLNLFWDEQKFCGTGNAGNGWKRTGGPTVSPEAAPISYCGGPWRVQQATWTSPLTNRFLLEAGFGTVYYRTGTKENGNTRDLIRVTEQGGRIPGLTYRSHDWGSIWNGSHFWRASASHVTGARSLKIGYQGAFLLNDQENSYTNDHRLAYRFNNGVPNQLTMIGVPPPSSGATRSRTSYHALYGQEQWTLGRLTLQGALRYDHAWSYFPAHQLGPDRFIPQPLVFPRMDGVEGYHDITPRFGLAYNLTGDAKTALKVHFGKYLEAASNNLNYLGSGPDQRVALTTTRSWTDANRNFMPDCDLMNPLAQDTRASGGDMCGAWANQNFGKNVFSSEYDPALLSGWGVRPSDWSMGVSVQREIVPGVSTEVGYYRRWLQNFTVTDNRAVAETDYDPFGIVAPSDPRLPDGGGYPVTGLYDVDPAKFGQIDNFVTSARNFGEQYQYWHGFDINVSARLRNGVTLQGGTSTGQTVTDNCEIRTKLPEIAPLDPYCHVAAGFLTQMTALAMYSIPKIDVLVSGAFRSQPGVRLAANHVVAGALVAPSLGRPLAGGAANVTVNLVDPGTLYGDRIKPLDLRVAKVFRFGRTSAQVGVDVYNVMNSSSIQAYNQTFGANWLTPTQVLGGRLARFSAQMDF